MNGFRKRKRQDVGGGGGSEADYPDRESRSNQSLPVAELPPEFNGIPLDGAQYLAVVRQESETVPDICYVANPYATSQALPSRWKQNNERNDASSSNLMPSLEWRKSFLKRFENMRNTLANRPQQATPSFKEKVPRGRNGKRWYRFLYGRSLLREVVYDDEDENGEEEEEEGEEREEELTPYQVNKEGVASKCREPTEALLHQFSTSQIISLLGVLPYWFTQPHVLPEKSIGQAIDPFQSRWLFSLLAHLEEHLIGDDINTLRILARACLACIVQSRILKGAGEEQNNLLEDELGAWMIVCAIAGIWGQHDLWEDAHRDLEGCAQVLNE